VKGSGDSVSDMFAEEFSDEMAKQFEDAMKNMVGDDPALVEQIEKLASAAGNAGMLYLKISISCWQCWYVVFKN
jgi:hypothetical protein